MRDARPGAGRSDRRRRRGHARGRFPAARTGGAVRYRDRLLRGGLLRVPRAGRSHRCRHRLVQDRDHRGVLSGEPGGGSGGHPGRAAAAAIRAAAGDDGGQCARRRLGRRDRRGAFLRLVPGRLAGRRDRERWSVLPAGVRRADRLVRAAAGAGGDRSNPDRRVRQHDLRAADLGTGRPGALAPSAGAAIAAATGSYPALFVILAGAAAAGSGAAGSPPGQETSANRGAKRPMRSASSSSAASKLPGSPTGTGSATDQCTAAGSPSSS